MHVFFSSPFVEWTAIVMVCLIFLAVCLSLCTLLQNVQIAYSKVQNRPQPNDRFYCWLNVTARRQSNINHCTCEQAENVDWRLVINSIRAAKLCCLCVYFRIGSTVDLDWMDWVGLGLDLDCDATNKSEYEYKSTVCALSEHRPESTCRYVSNQIDDQHCDSQQRHLTKSTCTQNMQQTHSKF